MKTPHSLKKSEEGAVLAIFAVALLPITVAAAIAIDVSRQSYINTQLAYACDAAAVAGARYEIADATANATKIFYANYPQTKNNVGVKPEVKISEDQSLISVSATSKMPTSLGVLGGIMDLNVYGFAQVKRSIDNLEIAMVLDVTGSMESNGKIAGLRQAATSLIDIIYEGKVSRPGTAISIVPYVATVNVGKQYTSWLADPATLTKFPSNSPWAGCVGAIDTGTTMDSDAPPSTTRLWPVYFAESTRDLSQNNSDNSWRVINGALVNATSPAGVRVGPNRSCGPSIMPLTNNSTTLKNLVNTLNPVPGGGTFGNLGLVWGWNTLSPRWIGKWQSTIQPMPYGPINLKSIVIVTDGENQWFDEPATPTGDPTAYGFTAVTNRLSTNKLGVTSINQSRAKVDERLSKLCTSIKNAGIQLFTVTFRVSSTSAKDLYKACATKPEWAYQAENSAQLNDQFSQIAREIKKIRIVK